MSFLLTKKSTLHIAYGRIDSAKEQLCAQIHICLQCAQIKTEANIFLVHLSSAMLSSFLFHSNTLQAAFIIALCVRKLLHKIVSLVKRLIMTVFVYGIKCLLCTGLKANVLGINAGAHLRFFSGTPYGPVFVGSNVWIITATSFKLSNLWFQLTLICK